MKPITVFSLADPNAANNTSRLVREGTPTDLQVEGTVLEAQYELQDGAFLVWVGDDVPYDAGLRIYLLDERARPIDALEAGATFTTGILKILAVGERSVDFAFYSNGTRYRLKVDDDRHFRLPLPIGWRYHRWLQGHRLTLSIAGRMGGHERAA